MDQIHNEESIFAWKLAARLNLSFIPLAVPMASTAAGRKVDQFGDVGRGNGNESRKIIETSAWTFLHNIVQVTVRWHSWLGGNQ